MKSLVILIVLSTLLTGAPIYAKDIAEGMPPAATGPIVQVSLIRLIAAPEQYDKAAVRVMGFFHLEFEGNALYFHKEDYENLLLSNAVRLDVPRGQGLEEYAGQYVMVQGIFKRCDDTTSTCNVQWNINAD